MGIMDKVNAAMAIVVIVLSINIAQAKVKPLMACRLTGTSNVVGTVINGDFIDYLYGKDDAQVDESGLHLSSHDTTVYGYQNEGIHSITKYLRFTNGGYNYVVYSVLDGVDNTNQGIAVFKDNKRIMNKKCDGEMKFETDMDFNNLVDYNVVPETEDTAGDILISIQ
ncbi:hypothetical protein [Lelliottia wanjuensis]|uniref:hypothetical protein n=1 Tax=Lelliottia wanjuensis TaxID=3050585 RepID=UPI00254B2ABE|nr:hypothetical protein [Lelliottia sp. V86_10]MDK9585732.1 hypothetical protein [Lelliottia sp. V86_10]